jgi:hypothetical protein
VRFASILIVLSMAGICFGQESLPGCEPSPEVRQVLKDKLNPTDLQKLKYADRVAREKEILGDLISRYPRELEPYHRQINFVHYQTDDYPALQSHYRDQGRQHPEDPHALFLAGAVLFHTDTPASIRLEEAAKAMAPVSLARSQARRDLFPRQARR